MFRVSLYALVPCTYQHNNNTRCWTMNIYFTQTPPIYNLQVNNKLVYNVSGAIWLRGVVQGHQAGGVPISPAYVHLQLDHGEVC